MNRATLLIANLLRSPTRTLLTLITLIVAFLLFMLLRAIADAFAGGVADQGVQRVYIDAKYSMTDNLPVTHVRAVADVPGVAAVAQMTWFGGYYQEPANAFAKMVVDHEYFFDVYPDIIVATDVLDRFRAGKNSVIVAEALARTFGWQAGDVIPIRGDIWPKADGSWAWQFELAGTYTAAPDSRVQPMFLLRYDYFNDSVMDWVKNNIGWMIVRLAPGADTNAVIGSIDALFENSSDPTASLSEDDYSRQFANQLGDMNVITTLILIAVFFTLLLLTANVAALGFSERIAELGVMKTLGFADMEVAALVMLEGVLLCAAGAVIGIACAFALEGPLQSALELVLGRFALSWADAAIALLIAVAIGVAIGVSPALAARRLRVVDALRQAG